MRYSSQSDEQLNLFLDSIAARERVARRQQMHQTSEQETQPGQEDEFTVRGEDLVRKVKELIEEGNVRRIIIRNKEGKTIVELPLTMSIIGTVIAPALAAVGAIAALVTECSIVVVRNQPET
jgi:hypothetical protein